MKKFLVQIILLIVAIGAGLYFFNPSGQTPSLPFLPQKPLLKQLQINGQILKAEVADTQEKRNKGLGGRQSLASDEGMLFIFDSPGQHPFWMKGLTFSLDFVWIRDMQVVDLLSNIPPPAAGVKDESLPIYASKVEVDKVLEVSSGTIQRLNIKVGDTINLTP